MRATWPDHPTLLDFIAQNNNGKVQTSELLNMQYSPAFPSLHPYANIHLSNPFSETLNLLSLLYLKNHVPRPRKR
jgi:hypothetical protein